MNIVMTIVLAVVGAVVYLFLNVVTRRMVAGVRSREDYDEDVDGKMTDAEKKAAEEAKVIEQEKKKIGFKDVQKEYGARFYIVAALGAGLALKVGPMSERISLYVPFSRLQDSVEIVNAVFSDPSEGG